jgi:peptidoglycan hydrolase-like protein with peptidoglycan-binding domain/DNA invertase Pin-like site-specific DNA recombinase
MEPKCFARSAQGRLISLLTVCLAMSLMVIVAGPAVAQAASRADVLRPGSGFERAGGSPDVRALQRRLRRLGQRPGPVDGLYGPLTAGAARRFQAGYGLVSDGVVGPRTRRALRHPGAYLTLRRGAGYDVRGGSRHVRAVQRRLRRLGQDPGPTDGLYGPLTQRAVERFQARAGLPVDGITGGQTRRAMAPRAHRTPRANGPVRSTPPSPTRTVRPPQTPARTLTTPSGDGAPLPTLLIALACTLALLGLAVLLAAKRRRAAPQLGTDASWPRADAAPVEDHEPDAELPVAAPVTPMDAVPVVGYLSVPKTTTDEEDDTTEQTAAIDLACRQRGLELLEVVRDVESENTRALDRPGLTYALDRISERTARGLVVARLDGVSRSAPDIGVLVEKLESVDARFVAVDFGLDTGTRAGRIAARALMSVCDLERSRLSAQTRRGIAAARARGSGYARPAVADRADLQARIATWREEGMSFQAIADTLNAEGVPTLRGGVIWRPSSVQAAAGYKRPPRKPANGRGRGDA